ncbi:helix-turn-helix domain-containing protein [Sphingomonas sp. VNH70]|uniref:MarR family transcriptional regulator n=1 Tax=Sphingomonas silueang TaxID=3156617 RepID=UPI0032B3A988
MNLRAKIAQLHGLKSSDPVHDILMEAYIAAEEGQLLSVSAVALMAGVKATTSLRYIGSLVEQGLLVRQSDPDDGRRYWVTLAPGIKAGMDKVFAALD